MGVEVVLDIYSGRENPKWSLDGPAIRELGQLLEPVWANKTNQLPHPPALGYRGFDLRTVKEKMPAHIRVFQGTVQTESGNFQDGGRTIEKWLVQRARPVVDAPTFKYLKSQVHEQ